MFKDLNIMSHWILPKKSWIIFQLLIISTLCIWCIEGAILKKSNTKQQNKLLNEVWLFLSLFFVSAYIKDLLIYIDLRWLYSFWMIDKANTNRNNIAWWRITEGISCLLNSRAWPDLQKRSKEKLRVLRYCPFLIIPFVFVFFI